MTEEQIKMLGFETETDESDAATPFYYYILDVTSGLSFITQPSDEVENEEWVVEFFETEIPVRYYDYDKVRALIELIEEGIIKNKEDE